MKNRVAALAGLFILIIEDESMVAMMLEDMLGDFGCRVTLAGTIEEALSSIRETIPDGVLLDMNLHGQNTVGVAEELARRSVPFLLVTGYGSAENDPPVIKKAPRLQKPFKEDVLSRRMTEIFVRPKSNRVHVEP